MSFKIYTKTGDAGKTSLIGGTRVPKHHARIEAYGTIDELNSWIGVIRDSMQDELHRNTLLNIQNELFVIGSLLAEDTEKNKMTLPVLSEENILHLEKEIDRMDESLSPLKNFILPGGNSLSSFTHIARCTCRRAERLVSALSENENVSPLIIPYINRLSDYLFTLARHISHLAGSPEIPWVPMAR